VSHVDDEELRRHFDALRASDLARVPAFAELARSAPSIGGARRTSARWVLVGGLGAAAAAAMLAVSAQRRQDAEWRQAAAEISAWQAPTDALLEISDRAPLGGPATLRASMLDSIIPPFLEN
jgi:hypothetical protein